MVAKKKKNAAAVALGRKGGLKGGKARAEKLSQEELSEQGRNAVMARWTKYYAEKEREKELKDYSESDSK
jgi:hypothetical protein